MSETQPQPEETKTVLVLGANGRTGLELIRSASNLPTKPAVHGFLRTPSKLAQADRDLCAAVHEGDATVQADLQRAIDACKPDAVIIAVGTTNRATTLRTDCSKALLEIIKPGTSYDKIRVAVVSSVGAGDSKIKVGMGIGVCAQMFLRNTLKDHTNAENVLKDGFGTEHAKRLLIVRCTTLMKTGKATGKVATFTKDEWPPTMKIHRGDVAQYIWNQLMGDGPSFGSAIGITTAK